MLQLHLFYILQQIKGGYGHSKDTKWIKFFHKVLFTLKNDHLHLLNSNSIGKWLNIDNVAKIELYFKLNYIIFHDMSQLITSLT